MHANKSLTLASDFNVVIGMIHQRSEEWWWAFAEPICHSSRRCCSRPNTSTDRLADDDASAYNRASNHGRAGRAK